MEQKMENQMEAGRTNWFIGIVACLEGQRDVVS